MATYNKFQDFVEKLGLAAINLNTDTIRVYLSNAVPSASLDAVAFTDLAEIAAGNGYTAGGEDTQNTYAEAAGTGTVTVVDVVWTASAGTIGPFQYVASYDDTHATNQLISWWDYGSALTLNATETFTVDFGSNTLFTIT